MIIIDLSKYKKSYGIKLNKKISILSGFTIEIDPLPNPFSVELKAWAKRIKNIIKRARK